MQAPEVRKAYMRATVDRDLDALAALLAEDVVLRSPVVPFAFNGRADVLPVYEAVLAAFGPIELLAEAGGEEGVQALRFETTVLGHSLQIATFLTVEDGRVAEVAVFARPLIGPMAIAAAVARPLARGRWQGLALVAMTRPLVGFSAAMTPVVRRLVRTRSAQV